MASLSHTAAPSTCRRALDAWLLEQGPVPEVTVLRAARLSAYAYTLLPRAHPLHDALRHDYVAALGRHLRLKQALLPLLRAWRADGIDVLLFKGFQLAEFVYPKPGARFHGDIDLLLRPEQVANAEQIARALGWYVARPPLQRFERSNHAFRLADTHAGALLDVHRQVVHAYLPWSSAQTRITAAVWRDSRLRSWEGIDIRLPAPVDALVVGIVLQRCWSGDRWQPKPHDVVDWRHIASRHGVTRAHMWERARALHCERTLAAFLQRCDPSRGILVLSPIADSERHRLARRVFRERGPLDGAERWLARAIRFPSMLRLALRFIPTVVRVRRALQRHADIRALLHALSSPSPATGSADDTVAREMVVAGVWWAMRLVGSGRAGRCLVRALATFVALRRRGWEVEFVSGVRREGRAIVGHAWVEQNGQVLLELDEPDRCASYAPTFRYAVRSTAVADPIRSRVGWTPGAIADGVPPQKTLHG